MENRAGFYKLSPYPAPENGGRKRSKNVDGMTKNLNTMGPGLRRGDE